MTIGLLMCGVRKQKMIIQAAVLGGLLLLAPLLRGQTADEDKKRLFLQSREDIQPVPKPSPSATARPKPRPKPKATPQQTPEDEPTPKPHPKPTPHATPKDEETPRPKHRRHEPANDEESPKPKKSSEEEPTPKPHPKPTPHSTPKEEESPRPKKHSHGPVNNTDNPRPKKSSEEEPSSSRDAHPSETPDFIPLPGENTKPKAEEKTTPNPTPTPSHSPAPAVSPAQIPAGKTPSGHPIDAPILIEKSGLDEQQGFEPPSIPFFNGFFKRWRYLTPGVRKAIDQASVKRGRWKYIVVHNSGTRQGNARIFDVYHRNVRKMQNGLAYHFVIGNGNSSGDGEIEIGNRWTRQINGGHVASDYLNDIALGICLVGDLNRDKPTNAQFGALDELITYLRIRVGKIKGKSTIVKGHKEINPKPTDCPGDRFPLGWLHQKFPG